MDQKSKKTDANAGKFNKRIALISAAVVVLAAASIAVYFLSKSQIGNPQTAVEDPVEIDLQQQNMFNPKSASGVRTMKIDGFTDISFTSTGALDDSISITRTGSYSGVFAEDGSDVQVSEVLALIVTNTGENMIEFAQITVTAGSTTAVFELSSLPVGQSALVMESSALVYHAELTYADASLRLISAPEKEFSLHTDIFSVRAADGVVNFINESDFKYDGPVSIYFKTVQNGIYIGGITYRVTLENGVDAGGVWQFLSEHYTVAGSELLFISYG